MSNKTNIEEGIKILKYFIKEFELDIENSTDKTDITKPIENILAYIETLEIENDIYKEEHQKITKALDFKEGTLNPDTSIVIKSMKQALIQLQAKANKYDSLVEKIESNLREKETIRECETISDREHLDGEIFALQELLDNLEE